MILLAIPEAVRSEIGSAATVDYDSIRTLSISVNPDDGTLSMRFELFVSSDAAKPPFRGSYDVDAQASTAEIKIERLAFETGVTLSPAQAAAAQATLDSHRDTVEGSVISFGLADGTQQ